ncbi:hypothetical protein QQP08_026696 [Theobroma cacao]|nr:hypothetical protein QQP08_026696 [Theobroma cacao]
MNVHLGCFNFPTQDPCYFECDQDGVTMGECICPLEMYMVTFPGRSHSNTDSGCVNLECFSTALAQMLSVLSLH